ncbi:ragulator complex protein LAMTOR3 [Palaemon carinicauda]|uniref:ragulator complex protein LAMTOR3 n=1 Tax=Palaemon carinicauda TaxID=392227 RepID=UPI0035B5EC1A
MADARVLMPSPIMSFPSPSPPMEALEGVTPTISAVENDSVTPSVASSCSSCYHHHYDTGPSALIIPGKYGFVSVSTEDTPELGMRPAFLSTFGMATDQAGKLGMGKNKRMVCIYGNYQVVHFNKLPLVITVIGTSTANTGLLMELEDQFSHIVSQLVPVVDIS